LPDAGLTRVLPMACHCWLAPPVQVHSSMGAWLVFWLFTIEGVVPVGVLGASVTG
jgi:hypothetical protein